MFRKDDRRESTAEQREVVLGGILANVVFSLEFLVSDGSEGSASTGAQFLNQRKA